MGNLVVYSLEDLAHLACRYVRSIIAHSTTALSWNNYDAKEKKRISQILSKLRKEKYFYSLITLGLNENIRLFYQTLFLLEKYHIGNCGEHAFLALSFLAHSTSFINAYIMVIEGGDHAAVIVEDCLICDSWPEIVEARVYPLSEYPSKLKNYYYIKGNDGEYINCLEDFDFRRHKIAFHHTQLNTADIRLAIKNFFTPETIKNKTLVILLAIQVIIIKLEKKLSQSFSLEQKIQSLPLFKKIDNLKQLIHSIENDNFNCPEEDYWAIKNCIMKLMNYYEQWINEIMPIKESEAGQLTQPCLTPLHYFLTSGNFEDLKNYFSLLEKNKVEESEIALLLQEPNTEKWYPIEIAVEHKDINAVKFLCEKLFQTLPIDSYREQLNKIPYLKPYSEASKKFIYPINQYITGQKTKVSPPVPSKKLHGFFNSNRKQKSKQLCGERCAFPIIG